MNNREGNVTAFKNVSQEEEDTTRYTLPNFGGGVVILRTYILYFLEF